MPLVRRNIRLAQNKRRTYDHCGELLLLRHTEILGGFVLALGALHFDCVFLAYREIAALCFLFVFILQWQNTLR